MKTLICAAFLIAATPALAVECSDLSANAVMNATNDMVRKGTVDIRIVGVTDMQSIKSPTGEAICHARIVTSEGGAYAYTYRMVHKKDGNYLTTFGPITAWTDR